MSRDHPRVCGEKGFRTFYHSPPAGSPPRVRGKAKCETDGKTVDGITPACAGKSKVLSCFQISDKDHPRVCGEKSGQKILQHGLGGSPPRVRGKDNEEIRRVSIERITPACAGKSLRRGICCVRRRGSPPRVRGKVLASGGGMAEDRITPACAGKRIGKTLAFPLLGDHPRVCGEKENGRRKRAHNVGSPPRVRGKDLPEVMVRDAKTITPACAGKRRSQPDGQRRAQDHPRVCGEKRVTVKSDLLQPGSPPRVRGKVHASPYHAGEVRITPACAGKRIEFSLALLCI